MATTITTTQEGQLSRTQSASQLSALLKQRSQVSAQKNTAEELKLSLAYLDKHGDIQEWYGVFGPESQLILCDPQLSLGAISSLEADLCPTLGLFKTCYQEDAIKWMGAQIEILNVSVSAQNKLTTRQVTILAADIFSQYYYWNLADVCVFFGKIRRGQWGVFYNNVDNISIMNWAREFDKERRHELDKYDTAVAEQKNAEAKANTPTQSSDEYFASLTEEQKAHSNLYAIETGKRKLFECAPKVEHTIKTGITKPADLDCPPPLSAETIARRDAMIAQLMRDNPEAFKETK